MILFIVAVFLLVLRFCFTRKWKRSLESSMGRWVYDGEYDISFWEWDRDVYEALVQLDLEFPTARVLSGVVVAESEKE